MNKRTDYEHQELDLDHNYYWFMNSDIDYIYKEPKLKAFREWFDKEEAKAKETSLYYKGTRLYFTFENKKYYVSWTFYSDELIDGAVKRLKELGAVNIQINYGELD